MRLSILSLCGLLGSGWSTSFLRIGVSLIAFTSIFASSGHAQDPEAAVSESYILRPGDSVKITVFNEPDLGVQQEIDPDGIVIIPLLGRTTLSGLTIRESETRIEELFIREEFLVTPQVTVSIVQHADQLFYVYGEVNSPGAKAFPPGKQSLDILEALTFAGGLSTYAKKNEVVLRRTSSETGQEEKITIDIEKLIRGNRKSSSELVEVRPNDIIFVPERLF
jgi:polysaccharide export outer membrane protein